MKDFVGNMNGFVRESSSNDNGRTSSKADIRFLKAAVVPQWMNRTASLFDRMFCCSSTYTGEQVRSEAQEYDYNLDDISIVDSIWKLEQQEMDQVMDNNINARPYDSDFGHVIKSRVSSKHFHFDCGTEDDALSVKTKKMSKRSADEHRIGAPRSFDTSTTVSMNSFSHDDGSDEQSLQSMTSTYSVPILESDQRNTTSLRGTSVTPTSSPARSRSATRSSSTHSNQATAAAVESTPVEDASPHAHKQQRQHQRRWSETITDPSIERIRQIQTESLAELPYLSKTAGYEC